jgi:oligopeptide/dipeptide ABC transporter ATP-binding protein
MASPSTSAVATHQPDRLEVDNLCVAFDGGRTPVVRGLSFRVGAGQAYGLVGESGSGKSLTCQAILGILPRGASASGRVEVGGRAVSVGSARLADDLRVAMIFQDPMSALNPVLRVGHSIAQVIASHDGVSTRVARDRAVELMRRVGIRDAEGRARSYPHEFSGGMRQRIVIAMALAARPDVLLADEPTTALDVVVQAGILTLLDRLRREESMSLLLVSHDFSIVAGMCERVGVMYAGALVEEGPTGEVLHRPRHPYTRGLIDSLPREGASGPLPFIAGSPPDPRLPTPGCAFSPRCARAIEVCRSGPIAMSALADDHLVRCIRPYDALELVASHTEAGERAAG